MPASPLESTLTAAGATWREMGEFRVPAHFGDPARDYEAATQQAALYHAPLRGLIEIRGEDRVTWLNNLVTNIIKTLAPGEGNYAFAPNVKGRIVADFNMLVMADALWLDIDRRLIETTLAHLDRYCITEDVQCTDRSDDFTRIALVGPKAKEITNALGATNAPAMASLNHTTVPLVQKQRPLVRHDFAGVFSAELYIEATDAETCWNRLIEIGEPINLTPVGYDTIETMRIEACIPASVTDINETILPAETQQIERAISYQKGCYLGQEVVERMRAYGGLAKKLSAITFPSDAIITPNTTVKAADKEAGTITSLCASPKHQATLALAYIKIAHANPGTELTATCDPPINGTVI